MKQLTSIFLTMIVVSPAFGFEGLAISPLSCPQIFPSYSVSNIYSSKKSDYFGLPGQYFQFNQNTYAYTDILVNANSKSDAKSKAQKIASSGLTPYTPTAIMWSQSNDDTFYYCAYSNGNYQLSSESPSQADAAQSNAAYVILYGPN